ncbi:MAG: DNA-binding response regulator [Candidatus Margulisbacteria bacterium GWF2_35_9]|nr:MAG: DNA-binding response regulator [Candidatus Margulisbacteria bacterium GWF2_35_9]
MKILIVEDEIKVLSFIQKGFNEHGFCVDIASDGEDGLSLALNNKYDCIILDIMLPSLSGIDILQKIRSEGIEIPVIFLTAKDTVSDRVMGFDIGGDDYLIKPFAFSELLARVKALIRRGKTSSISVLKCYDLILDEKKRTIVRKDKIIDVTPKEFMLLQYLLEHKGEVVTRVMLSESVWDYHFDPMTNVIDVHINNLRKKIDFPGTKELIHTIRGVGYVLK